MVFICGLVGFYMIFIFMGSFHCFSHSDTFEEKNAIFCSREVTNKVRNSCIFILFSGLHGGKLSYSQSENRLIDCLRAFKICANN